MTRNLVTELTRTRRTMCRRLQFLNPFITHGPGRAGCCPSQQAAGRARERGRPCGRPAMWPLPPFPHTPQALSSFSFLFSASAVRVTARQFYPSSLRVGHGAPPSTVTSWALSLQVPRRRLGLASCLNTLEIRVTGAHSGRSIRRAGPHPLPTRTPPSRLSLPDQERAPVPGSGPAGNRGRTGRSSSWTRVVQVGLGRAQSLSRVAD
jgi:hypothetical protein